MSKSLLHHALIPQNAEWLSLCIPEAAGQELCEAVSLLETLRSENKAMHRSLRHLKRYVSLLRSISHDLRRSRGDDSSMVHWIEPDSPEAQANPSSGAQPDDGADGANDTTSASVSLQDVFEPHPHLIRRVRRPFVEAGHQGGQQVEGHRPRQQQRAGRRPRRPLMNAQAARIESDDDSVSGEAKPRPMFQHKLYAYEIFVTQYTWKQANATKTKILV